ncbi:MAG: type II toxin-antitoxin system Phd/YefM family antitoxin [Gammaproteobacteria bacterium]
MAQWQLQEAKNKFSQVINACHNNGPQYVTKHGHITAVILSEVDYIKLKAKKNSLGNFLQHSPLAGMNLDITRSKDTMRDTEL